MSVENQNYKKEDINNYPVKIGTELPNWLYATTELNHEDYDLEVFDGIKFLLLDQQYFIDNTKIAYFIRRKLQVANINGINECANHILYFKPEEQTLALHCIQITKNDGTIINGLDTADIHILRKEFNAGLQMLSGDINLSIILENIQVGDIVNIAYSIVDKNMVARDYFNLITGTEYAVPLYQHHLVVLMQREEILKVKFHSNPTTEEVKRNHPAEGAIIQIDDKHVEISRSKIPARKILNYIPPWSNYVDSVQISIDKNWSEIAKLNADNFVAAEVVEPKLIQFLDKLNKQNLSKEQIVINLLSYINNNIRYLSNYRATDSIKPTDSNEVVKRGYGDCKDLSFLFINLLTCFNISCYPVLVSVNRGEYVPDMLPAANVFNHVLVMVKIDDKEYAVDPTLNQTVDELSNFYIENFGYGLSLGNNSSKLIHLKGTDANNKVSIKEIYKPLNKRLNNYLFTTEIELQGLPALRLIYFLHTNPESMFWDGTDAFYRRTLTIESREEHSINYNDIKKNIISYRVSYKGKLKGYHLKNDALTIDFIIREFLDYMPANIPDKIEADFYFGKQVVCSYEGYLHDYSAKFPCNQINIEDDAFVFNRDIKKINNYVLIKCVAEKKLSVIRKERYEKFSKQYEDATNSLFFSITDRSSTVFQNIKTSFSNITFQILYFVFILSLLVLLNLFKR